MSNNEKYSNRLEALKVEGNYRELPRSAVKGLVNLSSNDYLNLNHDTALHQEFRETAAFEKLKFSAGSTRLLTGNMDQYQLIEHTLADLYHREAALIYNSGYHANMGILPALTDKRDLIVADKEVHASMIDGMRLSQADCMRYRHLDLDHLEKMLNKYRHQYERVFLVTESIFSMDGRKADLNRLVDIKRRFGAHLYLDEAHAFGVVGERGLGMAEAEKCISEVDVIVGTLGKSLASLGAFVVCDQLIKQYLINTSRSLIYTTGLPPVNLAWTHFLLAKLPSLAQRRENLEHVWQHFARAIDIKAESHIIPYILRSNHKVIAFAKYMRQNGGYVLPIRHPTVPLGTERIRFSMHAGLKPATINPLINVIQRYEKKMACEK